MILHPRLRLVLIFFGVMGLSSLLTLGGYWLFLYQDEYDSRPQDYVDTPSPAEVLVLPSLVQRLWLSSVKPNLLVTGIVTSVVVVIVAVVLGVVGYFLTGAPDASILTPEELVVPPDHPSDGHELGGDADLAPVDEEHAQPAWMPYVIAAGTLVAGAVLVFVVCLAMIYVALLRRRQPDAPKTFGSAEIKKYKDADLNYLTNIGGYWQKVTGAKPVDNPTETLEFYNLSGEQDTVMINSNDTVLEVCHRLRELDKGGGQMFILVPWFHDKKDHVTKLVDGTKYKMVNWGEFQDEKFTPLNKLWLRRVVNGVKAFPKSKDDQARLPGGGEVSTA